MTNRRLQTISSTRYALLCSSALIGIGMIGAASPAVAQSYPITSGGTVSVSGSGTVTDSTATNGGVDVSNVNGTVTLSGLNIVANGANGLSLSDSSTRGQPNTYVSTSPNSIHATSGDGVSIQDNSGSGVNYTINGAGGDSYQGQNFALTISGSGPITFNNNGTTASTFSSGFYGIDIETDGNATVNAGLMNESSYNGIFIRGNSASFTSTGGSLSGTQGALTVSSGANGNTNVDSQSTITSYGSGITTSSAFGGTTIRTSGNGTITATGGAGIQAYGRGTMDIGADITASSYFGNVNGIYAYNPYTSDTFEITNRATVHSNGAGVYLTRGGTIYNAGTIQSDNEAAIKSDSGLSQVINYGVLDGANGVGIQSGGTLYAELHAGSSSGTVIATASNSTVYIENGTGILSGGTLNDAGTAYLQTPGTHDAAAFDSIQLGGGTNTLYLSGNGIDTLADGAAGTLDVGTVTFSPSGSLKIVKIAEGNWTLTGDLTAANTSIYSGESYDDGGYLTFAFNSIAAGLDPEIYVNGGAITTNSAGGFGANTIHAVDPLILFGASGTYANDILLEVAGVGSGNPSNTSTTPTMFAAAGGTAVTLSGAITTGTDTNINNDDIDQNQPVVFTGGGQFLLTNARNSWTGTTTIDTDTTLQGTSATISGSSIVNDGTLIYDQASNGTAAQGITGTGDLIKQGTGNLTLTGTSNYSGTTTINAGTLTGSSSSISGSAIVDNAALVYNQTTNGTASQDISGSGTLTKTGAGNLTLSGANSNSGLITISAGTLTGTTTSIAGSAIVDNAALVFDQATNGTYAQTISGTGSLTKAGAGILTLAGANSNAGTITISGGALVGTTASIAGSNIVDNSLLVFSQSANGTYGHAISGTGSLAKTGSGTLTLGTSATYTGATIVAAGTLALGSGVKLASTALMLLDASSVLDSSNSTDFSVGDLTGVAGSQFKANGVLTLGSANSTEFAGNILGVSGITKVGTGTTLLSGTNSVSGPVLVNAGTLAVTGVSALSSGSTVTIASGAMFAVSGTQTVANLGGSGVAAVDTASTLTFGGDNAASSLGGFTGAGALVKTGTGAFTLAGNSALTGLTTVSGGKLVLAANMAGAVSVLQGATLAGSGTVGALNVAAGATLSPGASDGAFGTIRASSLTTAGTIRIDFGGVSTGVASDKIIVSGAINVTGGTIDAHPTSATKDYTFNQYFALTAGTTFTGTFTNSTDWVTNSYDTRLKQRIRYDLGAGAVLEVRYMQDLTTGVPTSGTGNSYGVAASLNGTQQGASDSFAPLINALADQTPTARQQSLQQLSGEGSVSGNEMAGANMSSFLATVGAHAAGGAVAAQSQTAGYLNALKDPTRLAAVIGMSGETRVASTAADEIPGSSLVARKDDERRLGLWLQGYGVNQRIGAGDGFARTKTTGVGAALGLDMSDGRGTVFGLALGYAEPKTDVSTLGSSSNGKAVSAAVYGGLTRDALQLTATLGYASTRIHTNRSVTIGALKLAPRGSTRSDTLGATVSAGYRIEAGNHVAITPTVSAEYSHDHTNAFAETNGGAANLAYDGVKLDRLIAKAGFGLSKSFKTDAYVVTPTIRGGGAASFGDRGLTTTIGFTAAPVGTGSFLVQGARLPKTWGTAGIGLAVAGPHSPISVAVDYDGGFARRYTSHQITGTLRYRF